MIAVWGPGLLVMLADTDAGNVVTAAQAGARWGYRLALLLFALAPALFLMQDVSLRLGVFAREGLGTLIRRHTGRIGAGVALVALVVATLASLVTEFSGVAGVGELFGVSRGFSVPAAAVVLVGVVLTGEYRRTEAIALLLGLFEAAFFFVAWRTHPHFDVVVRQAADWPLGNADFLYLVAGLIGATFNPWMLFYQSSAVVAKGLGPADYAAARADTLFGAIVTQALTTAVLGAAAALIGGEASGALDNIGEISATLTPLLGQTTGRLVFGVGVVGAAMAAAIVATLACAWGSAELLGRNVGDPRASLRNPGFLTIYALAIVASGALALVFSDLVSLSVAMQVVNAALLPAVGALTIYVGVKALPPSAALGRARVRILVVLLAVVSLAGGVGVVAGLL
jgi:Mn2+/Fe2+ NRAMP family transporter